MPLHILINRVFLQICKWTVSRKKFKNLKLGYYSSQLEGLHESWILEGERAGKDSIPLLKFYVNGAARRKPSPADVDEVLRNFNGPHSLSFSKYIKIRDSNEAETGKFRNVEVVCALCLCSKRVFFFNGNDTFFIFLF